MKGIPLLQPTTPVGQKKVSPLLAHVSGKYGALLILLCGCLAAAIILWQVSLIQTSLVNSVSLRHAQVYSNAITVFRSVYTSEVVEPGTSNGILFTREYKNQPGSLPLPATLTILLGQRLSELHHGAGVRLYSPYPFPGRPESEGIQDDFDRDAWEYLHQNPNSSFREVTMMNGRPVLRYATADVMHDACINCHNNHIDSPKTDWKVGDVRGVIEVEMSLEGVLADATESLKSTYLFIASVFVLIIGSVVFAFLKLRNTSLLLRQQYEKSHELSTSLENQVDRRTSDLRHEIDVRSEAEFSAKKAKEMYRGVLNQLHDAQITSDSSGVIVAINPACERIFGYSSDELIGKNVAILLPSSDRDAHQNNVDRYNETGEARILGLGRSIDSVGQHKDATCFPLKLMVVKFTTERESFFSAVIRDMTKERARADELHRLEAAVEGSADNISIYDSQWRLEYMNSAYAEYTGWSKQDALGKFSWELQTSDVDDEVGEITAKGKTWTGRQKTTLRDGQIVEVEATVSPVKDRAGVITNYVSVARDVTEQAELEQQLAQAQKLESIGQLAAGIAHEINTPIQYVGDNTRFVKDAFDDVGVLFGKLKEFQTSSAGSVTNEVLSEALAAADVEYLQEEVPRALEQTLEGIGRVANIVRAMKEFSHPAQDKTSVDLNAAIQSTLTVATNEWKYVADLQTDFDASLPLVVCLPGEFNQVILNMIVNASHAISDALGEASEEKGVITITTRNTDNWAEITISDSGSGMPEEVKARIFDPFYTTKEVGKGTGQGLAIAHDVVVSKHGGKIDVESKPGRGTTFTIRLPINPEEV